MTDEKLEQQPEAPGDRKMGEAALSISIKPAAVQIPGKPQKLDVNVSIPQDPGMAIALLKRLQDAVLETVMEDSRALGIQQGLQMQANQRMVKTPDELGVAPGAKLRLT